MDGGYDLPNDELEQDRLDLQHGIWLEALDGKLQCAPISGDVQDILDIATGTGNWVIDTADAHPSARIIGVDLRIPPNCEFEVDDAEADWTYHHKFDFIHGRLLSIGWRDWDKLCRQSFRFLKPSGWVEYQEYTWPMICACAPNTHPPSLITEYCTHVVDAASKRNIHMQTPSTLTSRLKAAGFINIHVKEFPWYVSEPKIKKAALQGLEGIALRLFTERLGWSKERMMVYLTQVRKAFMEETERHIYVPM
ncbi:MAG: hypothetical protein M1834_001151 [Cirrosporium novae-zelandiae]|nr:MAG: hypothetical protein M1834_001151 [Cirrosporium novae-zelandiae]